MMDENQKSKNTGLNDPVIIEKPAPRGIICHNCKERVVPVDLVCPECGHYIAEGKQAEYQPISPKTRRIVKTVLTIFLLTVFILLVLFNVIKLDACQSSDEADRLTNLCKKQAELSKPFKIFAKHIFDKAAL